MILLCCCGHGEEEEGARAPAGSGKKQSSSGEGLGAAFRTDGDLDAGERWRRGFGEEAEFLVLLDGAASTRRKTSGGSRHAEHGVRLGVLGGGVLCSKQREIGK